MQSSSLKIMFSREKKCFPQTVPLPTLHPTPGSLHNQSRPVCPSSSSWWRFTNQLVRQEGGSPPQGRMQGEAVSGDMAPGLSLPNWMASPTQDGCCAPHSADVNRPLGVSCLLSSVLNHNPKQLKSTQSRKSHSSSRSARCRACPTPHPAMLYHRKSPPKSESGNQGPEGLE